MARSNPKAFGTSLFRVGLLRHRNYLCSWKVSSTFLAMTLKFSRHCERKGWLCVSVKQSHNM